MKLQKDHNLVYEFTAQSKTIEAVGGSGVSSLLGNPILRVRPDSQPQQQQEPRNKGNLLAVLRISSVTTHFECSKEE